jgi:hypothetical protein
MSVSLSKVLDFFHISNFANPTDEESKFLFLLYSDLVKQACLLASVLPWDTQRPLNKLLDAMRDKNQVVTNRKGDSL